MNLPPLEVDYLIIGSGAVGMAFADVIFHETKSSILIVDKHHGPGGHWNDAYPFVRLHQPSAYYGVNSRKLGGDSKDPHHLNLGMCERATSAEIVSYYENVMQVFLASDRVQYFPMNEVDVSNPQKLQLQIADDGCAAPGPGAQKSRGHHLPEHCGAVDPPAPIRHRFRRALHAVKRPAPR